MKKIVLLLLFPLMSAITFAQNKTEAEKLVNEGVAYHDKGDYQGAIAKYDKALELDEDNLSALTEKAFSLLMEEKYDESIKYCKKAIEKHPADKYLSTVYVTYGNALDGLKKTDKSIEIYDEGLKQFPDDQRLIFNKGITLASVKKYDEAIVCFQNSVMLNPTHAGSHNALARILDITNKRIPALLIYCRFLAIEPQSERAKQNLIGVKKIMNGNAEKTGKKSVTINISPDMLEDTTADGKPKENSFATTDLLLSMDAALDYDKKFKNNTEVEQFIRKFESVCASLAESKKDNFGFYWDYYTPYFIEMKNKSLIETFAYIAFSSSDDTVIARWLNSHKSEIDKFKVWSANFSWKKN